MTVSRRDMLAALPAAALATAATARAQTPAAQPPAGGQPTGRDPLLAACMQVGGKRQIEVCQFAMGKLQNDECKAFAKAEIDEHVTLGTKLKGIGLGLPEAEKIGTGGLSPAAVEKVDGQITPAGGAGETAAGGLPAVKPVAVGAVQVPGAGAELLTIDAQVADQCVLNYKAMMSKKEGAKFDKAFVGDQLHEHQGLLDKVQVYRRHASAAMQPALTEAQQTIEQHIRTCEQIMQKLDAAK